MKKALLAAVTLGLMSPPALAQGEPGRVDGTLGNGVQRSTVVPGPTGPVSSQAPGMGGNVDGTLGNGVQRSTIVPGPTGPVSSQAPGMGGNVDGTLGNGVQRSTAVPGGPSATGTINPAR